MKLSDRLERLEAQVPETAPEFEVLFIRPGAGEPVRKLEMSGDRQTWFRRAEDGAWKEDRDA